jgi:membrane fusion protein (multidrug efflux system)
MIVAGILFAACKQKPAPPPPPVPVNLFTVKARDVLYYDQYPSTTVALSQVDIRPEVQGYITGIFFKEGGLVKKGEKLYEIDRRLYQAAYDQAEANLKVAEENQKEAQQDADRYVYLNEHNAVAKQVLDHAVIALQSAKDQTQAAQQAVQTAATNLNYSIITSPFNGTIGISQVRLGNMVTVGTTILNTVSTDDPMGVDILVNEAQLMRFQELDKNTKTEIDSLFTIILPNHSIYTGLGKISIIDRAVDPQTGTVRVRIVFPNTKHVLRAGMSCILRVHNLEAGPQMIVPGRAVVEQMGEYFLFVARDTVLHSSSDTAKNNVNETSKLRAFQNKVQLGQTIGADVIVRSGIQEGDRVVVDGVQAIHEGSEINPNSKTTGNKTDSAGTQKKDSTGEKK